MFAKMVADDIAGLAAKRQPDFTSVQNPGSWIGPNGDEGNQVKLNNMAVLGSGKSFHGLGQH